MTQCHVRILTQILITLTIDYTNNNSNCYCCCSRNITLLPNWKIQTSTVFWVFDTLKRYGLQVYTIRTLAQKKWLTKARFWFVFVCQYTWGFISCGFNLGFGRNVHLMDVEQHTLQIRMYNDHYKMQQWTVFWQLYFLSQRSKKQGSSSYVNTRFLSDVRVHRTNHKKHYILHNN